MRRKTFDIILASGGLVVTVVLVVAGSLLMWGYHFANSNVHVFLRDVFASSNGPDIPRSVWRCAPSPAQRFQRIAATPA